MSGVIYKIQNMKNNKIYIGQTIQGLEKRLKGHYSNGRNQSLDPGRYKDYFPYNYYLQKDDFLIEIIEENIGLEDLDHIEEKWIKYYNENNESGVYNIIKRTFIPPMYYDGSKSRDQFLLNNSIRKDEHYYSKHTIDCDNCDVIYKENYSNCHSYCMNCVVYIKRKEEEGE